MKVVVNIIHIELVLLYIFLHNNVTLSAACPLAKAKQ